MKKLESLRTLLSARRGSGIVDSHMSLQQAMFMGQRRELLLIY
jgi:hypothetical protein